MGAMIGLLAAMLLGCGSAPEAPEQTPPDAAVAIEMVKPALRDPKWSDARCNDGTPFGLSVRRAESDTWVIKVSGGYFCEDHISPCSERKKRLTTTPTHKNEVIADGAEHLIQELGLFSRDPDKNPDFHDANQVVLWYCSSDLWLGDQTERRESSGSPDGWYFSGRRNLAAAMEILVERYGLQDGSAKVLVAGHSAGGMGVVSNLPLFEKHLPKARAGGDLKLVIDGAWVPRQPDLVATPIANRWGPLNEACTAALEAEGTDPRNCVFGDVWYPHVRNSMIPILVQQSALDTTQAGIYKFKGPGAKAWRDRARQSLEPVEWLFSGGFAYHTVIFEPKFNAGKPGRSFQEVVGRFWRDGEPERILFRYEE